MMNKNAGDIGMGEIQRLSACRNPTIITLSMLSSVEEKEIVSTYQRRGVMSRKSEASGGLFFSFFGARGGDTQILAGHGYK
jgi:proteasome assembly chaperone (PAC2) family protein